MIDLGERLLAFEWSYLRLLEEDVALPRLVLRTAAAIRGRRRRRPLHEAGERPDVGLGHLQRLVLGQLVVCKVGKNKCISSRHAQVTYQYGRLYIRLSLIYHSKRKGISKRWTGNDKVFVASSHGKSMGTKGADNRAELRFTIWSL